MEKSLMALSSNWDSYLLLAITLVGGFLVGGLFFSPKESANKFITRFAKHVRALAFISLAAIIVLLIMLLIGSYIDTFRNQPISKDPAHWGQMGDFFGGMLNPILAFASFIALLFTIKLQSDEMKDTRKELQKSRIAQQNLVEQALADQKNQSNRERYKILLSSMVDSNDRVRSVLRKPFTKVDPSDMPSDEKCPADIVMWCSIRKSFQNKESLREAFAGYLLNNVGLFHFLLDDVRPILSECRRLKVIANDFEAACLDLGMIPKGQVDIMNPVSFEQLLLKDSAFNLQKARWLSEAFDSFTEASFTPAPGSVLDKFSQD